MHNLREFSQAIHRMLQQGLKVFDMPEVGLQMDNLNKMLETHNFQFLPLINSYPEKAFDYMSYKYFSDLQDLSGYVICVLL